jgi:hypothetical protein
VRPIRPEDERLYADFMAVESQRDLRWRFFAPVKGLAPELITRLTHIDYTSAMAFIALDEAAGEMLGVARLHCPLVALGFPDYGPGDQLGKRRGHIIGRATKYGVKLIEVSAMLPGGISGGPIVNDRYQVIAVAQRGGNQEHKQLAVEISELLRLAKE